MKVYKYTLLYTQTDTDLCNNNNNSIDNNNNNHDYKKDNNNNYIFNLLTVSCSNQLIANQTFEVCSTSLPYTILQSHFQKLLVKYLVFFIIIISRETIIQWNVSRSFSP